MSRRVAQVTAAVVVLLGLGAGNAMAATTAEVRNGVLEVAGDAGPDKIDVTLASPESLVVDLGEDGTADFTFDRATFTAIDVHGGDGDDELRVEPGLSSLIDEPIT